MGYNYELRLYVATSPDGNEKNSATEWYSGSENGARARAIKLLKGVYFDAIPKYVEIRLAGHVFKGEVFIRQKGNDRIFGWHPAVGKSVPLNENGKIREEDAWHPFGL